MAETEELLGHWCEAWTGLTEGAGSGQSSYSNMEIVAGNFREAGFNSAEMMGDGKPLVPGCPRASCLHLIDHDEPQSSASWITEMAAAPSFPAVSSFPGALTRWA